MALGIRHEGTSNFLDQIDDIKVRYQALHHQLVASAKTVIAASEIDPDIKVGNMIAMMPVYPLTPNPKDMLLMQKEWREKQYYCSDVQVKGEYPYYAQAMWNKMGIELDITDEDKDILKKRNSRFLCDVLLSNQLRNSYGRCCYIFWQSFRRCKKSLS